MVSRHMHSVFKFAPLAVQADYILERYTESLSGNPRLATGLVSKALRYPICSTNVIEALLRLPHCPEEVTRSRVELPRRLFRHLSPQCARIWTGDDHPLPFLRYLYQHSRFPRPYTDSWEGYPLTRAVSARFTPLIRFLLDQGASPGRKGAIAVQVAIRLKDLALVKMLIEPPSSPPPGTSHDDPPEVRTRVEIRRKKPPEDDIVAESSAKRRKLEDRVEISQDMLQTAVACNARDIVDYFMHEKSCMPDMQTVKMINRAGRASNGGSRGRRKKIAR